MTRKKTSQNKKVNKTKKIGHIFNKVFDDFKKNKKLMKKKKLDYEKK